MDIDLQQEEVGFPNQDVEKSVYEVTEKRFNEYSGVSWRAFEGPELL